MGVPPPLVMQSKSSSGSGVGDDGAAPMADFDSWRHYIEASPVTHAHKLQGDLLLAYGTGDDNCHYQNACVL